MTQKIGLMLLSLSLSLCKPGLKRETKEAIWAAAVRAAKAVGYVSAGGCGLVLINDN